MFDLERPDKRIDEALALYAPTRESLQPDWDDVMSRATPSETARKVDVSRSALYRREPKFRRSRLSIFVVAVGSCALVAATLAIAASQNWWFSHPGGLSSPIGQIEVVARGAWDKKAWSLTAYRGSDGATCYALTPGRSNPSGRGATASCAFVGPTTSAPTRNRNLFTPITAFASGKTSSFPAYLVGPVIDTAAVIRIDFNNSGTINARLYSSPTGLGASLRFFASPIPCSARLSDVVATNAQGAIVARMNLQKVVITAKGTPNPCAATSH